MAVIARDKPACPLCRTQVEAGSLIEPPPPEARSQDEGGGECQEWLGM